MKNGWQTKKLCEVADIFDGPHATPKTVDSGPIFLGISALQDGAINLGETRHVTKDDFKRWTRRVKPQKDDIVFSYETRLGQAGIIPDGLECCLGRRMGLVRFKNGEVIPRFFLYQYISPVFREFLDSKTIRGATVDRFSIKEFPSFPINVPPLPEQQRIVGILDKSFEGIVTAKADAEKNLQNARALFQSHLESVFTHRGTGWTEKHLKDVCEKITDGTHQTPTYYDEGIIFLSSRNVTGGRINWDDIKYIDTKQHLEMHKRVAPRRNDILLAKNGTTGVAAIVDRDITFDIYVSLALLRPRNEILPHLLLHFVNSPVAKRQFNKRLKGMGVPNLHLEEIREVVISFPKSLQEQEALATKLYDLRAETQRLASVYERKLAALCSLKKSLLHQAFTGQL